MRQNLVLKGRHRIPAAQAQVDDLVIGARISDEAH